ncbi:MAG: RluA family pseudouridine synthase, partial [Patescibacteria group bacterium]
MPQWIVSLPDRLDTFLSSDGRMQSRAKAKKAIDRGLVKVNDEIADKPALRLQEGDTVALEEEEIIVSDTRIVPEDLHFQILHEDDACMVIDKPAGYAVHPGIGTEQEMTILNGIAYLFGKRNIPFTSESVLVHRLDKDTTGCLLVAKNPAAHLFLQEQFESRSVKKTYLALVAGIPNPAAATIDAPIGRSNLNRTKMSIHGSSATREAQTTYRTLASAHNASLLECDLHTGRTHQ